VTSIDTDVVVSEPINRLLDKAPDREQHRDGDDQRPTDDQEPVVAEQREHGRRETDQRERSDTCGFLRPLPL